MLKVLNIPSGIRWFLIATISYLGISIFFLFGLIISPGNVAQQDWDIPLTSGAAFKGFQSFMYAWQYNGFGGQNIGWGFPFFPFFNAFLAPIGFIGGTEIKVLSVFLVALGGITTYALARSFGLRFFSSFLSGLFFMSTAVVFNWLLFGFIYYLMAYDLLPLMLLVTKKYLETNNIRYILINGIILAIALGQPTFILIYPLLGLLFAIFESKGNIIVIKRGLIITVSSVIIFLLISLGFLLSYNNVDRFSFYQGNFFEGQNAQFSHFSIFLNPIRLWGSTFNFQFETYFPSWLTFVSFAPIALALVGVLLKPRDRRIIFFLIAYISAGLAYLTYINFHYLVYNLPYGSIFEAPSIYLAPASVGLALLIGYTHETISINFQKFNGAITRHLTQILCFTIILIIIIFAGVPWWTGQAYGNPNPGAPTKLNLYSMPSDYTEWNNLIAKDDEYFVFYIPFTSSNVAIAKNKYFSLQFEGVSASIFTKVSNLPYISATNSKVLLNELVGHDSEVAESWGSKSIKYIVVYKNVIQSDYDMNDLLAQLSKENGITQVVNLPDVAVYQNQFAKPVIYANNSNTNINIVHHDPTSYKIVAYSDSPFQLVLNQTYSSNWKASIDGTALPIQNHTKDNNGFNRWDINRTGTVKIDLYYEPQTRYYVSMLFSIGVLSIISIYIIFTLVMDIKHLHK